MKLYELTYLISPDLTKEDLKKLETEIITFLQKQGGILDKIKKPIEKKLGYAIKKQNAAFLAVLNFYLEQGKIPFLEEELKSKSKIFRYLILSKKEEKTSSLKKEIVSKPKKEVKEKVEIKEIEKKLEEILKED